MSMSDKFFNVIRLRKATLLALFALASMQLVLAGHQFEHSAASAVESCHVCVQADRLDDIDFDSTAQPSFGDQRFVVATQAAAVIHDNAARKPFNSRAPPTL